MFRNHQKEVRIYFRARKPNPLFESWLEEWLKEAELKDSMRKVALAKALESLRKYPLVLHSGRDCMILEGFGKGICAMLDHQLMVYRESNPSNGLLNEEQLAIKEKSIISDVKKKLEKKQNKKTVEALKLPSGLDDTLEALFRKYDNIDDDGQQLDNANEMEDAIDLSDEDNALFMQPEVRIPRNSFKIILLVDTQETSGKSKRQFDATIQALEVKKINYEVRRLSAGDFLWICRDTTGSSKEVVLPYIIERKRMDDFASSIKDGRFHEQKFRLNESGLQNKIYLIENRGNNLHVGLPLPNLLQAATNTQVHSMFSIKFTDSLNDSMLYLATMTKLLNNIYQSKDLIVTGKEEIEQLPSNYYVTTDLKTEIKLMEFKEFTEITTKMKNFTIRDLFLRQLIQLKSLSVDKAVAIAECYPTPQSLIRAYQDCKDRFDAENLLTNIQFGKFKKPVGATISKIIYNLYSL